MSADIDRGEIDRRLTYYPPTTSERVANHQAIRRRCRDLGHILADILPAGREKSLAITHLEEAMFWANAAIARNDDR